MMSHIVLFLQFYCETIYYLVYDKIDVTVNTIGEN